MPVWILVYWRSSAWDMSVLWCHRDLAYMFLVYFQFFSANTAPEMVVQIKISTI